MLFMWSSISCDLIVKNRSKPKFQIQSLGGCECLMNLGKSSNYGPNTYPPKTIMRNYKGKQLISTLQHISWFCDPKENFSSNEDCSKLIIKCYEHKVVSSSCIKMILQQDFTCPNRHHLYFIKHEEENLQCEFLLAILTS